MTFCSLSEAWGQGPDGIETGKYQPVNYEDSNIYKNSGEPVFDTTIEKQSVKRIPNMSRTQERLPQHNGPSNRYSENVKNVSINYDDNNNISADDAETLMSWLIKKITKPRKSIGVKIFANPMIQLGDIVSVDYTENSLNKAGSADSRFVVYNIEYSKSKDGPEMSVFLSEVI